MLIAEPEWPLATIPGVLGSNLVADGLLLNVCVHSPYFSVRLNYRCVLLTFYLRTCCVTSKAQTRLGTMDN